MKNIMASIKEILNEKNSFKKLEEFMITTSFKNGFQSAKEKNFSELYFNDYRYHLNDRNPNELVEEFRKSFVNLFLEFVSDKNNENIKSCSEYPNFMRIKKMIIDEMGANPAKYLGPRGEGMGF